MSNDNSSKKSSNHIRDIGVTETGLKHVAYLKSTRLLHCRTTMDFLDGF